MVGNYFIKKIICSKCKKIKYVTEFDYNIFTKEYTKMCKNCLSEKKDAK